MQQVLKHPGCLNINMNIKIGYYCELLAWFYSEHLIALFILMIQRVLQLNMNLLTFLICIQHTTKDAEQNDQILNDKFRINLVEYIIIRILILRDQILLHFVKQKIIQANQNLYPFPAKTNWHVG